MNIVYGEISKAEVFLIKCHQNIFDYQFHVTYTLYAIIFSLYQIYHNMAIILFLGGRPVPIMWFGSSQERTSRGF